MLNRRLNLFDRVHCRTGSLESGMAIAIAREYVHCRTGNNQILGHVLMLFGEQNCERKRIL